MEGDHSFQFVLKVSGSGKPDKALRDNAQFLLRCLAVSMPGTEVYYQGKRVIWDSDKKEVVFI